MHSTLKFICSASLVKNDICTCWQTGLVNKNYLQERQVVNIIFVTSMIRYCRYPRYSLASCDCIASWYQQFSNSRSIQSPKSQFSLSSVRHFHQIQVSLSEESLPSSINQTASFSQQIEPEGYPDSSANRVHLFSHKVNADNLVPGDHIYAHRDHGLYDHHGIYIGENDAEVIHFPGDKATSNRTSIQASSLRHFVDGETVRLVAYSVPILTQLFKKRAGTSYGSFVSCHKPETVVEIAKTYLHKPHQWIKEHGPYHLYSNNCEHFAHFCKTGRFCSKQTNHGRSMVDIVTDIVIPPKMIFSSPKYVRQLVVYIASRGFKISTNNTDTTAHMHMRDGE